MYINDNMYHITSLIKLNSSLSAAHYATPLTAFEP